MQIDANVITAYKEVEKVFKDKRGYVIHFDNHPRKWTDFYILDYTEDECMSLSNVFFYEPKLSDDEAEQVTDLLNNGN